MKALNCAKHPVMKSAINGSLLGGDFNLCSDVLRATDLQRLP